jgi:cephalosporin-C deacetylase
MKVDGIHFNLDHEAPLTGGATTPQNPINYMRNRLLGTLAGVFLATASAMAATNVSLVGSTDQEPVAYQPGETITFKLQLLEDGKPLAGKTIKWVRTGDDGTTANGEAVTVEAQPLTVATSTEQPGFIRIEATAFNADGSPLQDARSQTVKFDGGAGVAPGKLAGYPEPADFDAFWKAQKARLAQVPPIAELTEVSPTNAALQIFDVKINCVGKPVSGYISRPRDAKAKSLPAQISFHGYGVRSANQPNWGGAIAMDVNAHGIENGRPAEYYRKLEQGELKNYAFNKEANARPETAYFNGLMLRVLRALEYLKSRPEWDGKTLIVSGGSQGGLQAITAAALDPDVTKCNAYKPWCCDLGGAKLGRLSGWRPDWTEGLAYYDIANMAQRVHCETYVSAGLGDYVCPPSGVSVLYNRLQGPKTIDYLQGSTHGYDPPDAQRQSLHSPSR